MKLRCVSLLVTSPQKSFSFGLEMDVQFELLSVERRRSIEVDVMNILFP